MSRSTAIGLGLLVFVVAVLSVFLLVVFHAFDQAARVAGDDSSAQTSAQPEGRVEEPVQAAARQEVIEATQAPAAVQEAPAPQPAPPIVSERSKQMSAGGIAESDQPTAEQLIFNGETWALWDCVCNRTAMVATDPIARFSVINNYVTRTYGPWSAAQAQAETGNW